MTRKKKHGLFKDDFHRDSAKSGQERVFSALTLILQLIKVNYQLSYASDLDRLTILKWLNLRNRHGDQHYSILEFCFGGFMVFSQQ